LILLFWFYVRIKKIDDAQESVMLMKITRDSTWKIWESEDRRLIVLIYR
jgi:hypothetical protein